MWAARVAVCLITLSPPPRWAHRKGAPVTTCNEMEPRHDKEVMHSHHYYQIVVDRLQGEQLRVTLMALNNQTSFRGFLIRAMRVQGSSLAYHGGRFEKDAAYPNVQFIACDGVESVRLLQRLYSFGRSCVLMHKTDFGPCVRVHKGSVIQLCRGSFEP
ncbi:hypothetical protein IscW_ISCW020429 [Ixodes scapularis]|uniref:Reelin domain-containing protein n=1 Tax=Ixodes scapularis TaxID=6945 RepID=B7PZX4_IXOSC|nr:hypothetical protein IscW_ISCW020429 [Ixodes scapularis]|eukprot:XP_002406334.1 hypothetical protein IscW_ISCW020429 [Ixodes scapularis]